MQLGPHDAATDFADGVLVLRSPGRQPQPPGAVGVVASLPTGPTRSVPLAAFVNTSIFGRFAAANRRTGTALRRADGFDGNSDRLATTRHPLAVPLLDPPFRETRGR